MIKASGTLLKILLAVLLLAVLLLATCDVWGSLDNPTDAISDLANRKP